MSAIFKKCSDEHFRWKFEIAISWIWNLEISSFSMMYDSNSPSQWYPWSMLYHGLWGEFSICALCCSYSQSLQFSFLVPPGTHHCWVDRGGVIWEACPWHFMCYHCVRIAVGSHRHLCSTRRQVQLCPLPRRHIRCHFLYCGEPNSGLLRDSQVV